MLMSCEGGRGCEAVESTGVANVAVGRCRIGSWRINDGPDGELDDPHTREEEFVRNLVETLDASEEEIG